MLQKMPDKSADRGTQIGARRQSPVEVIKEVER